MCILSKTWKNKMIFHIIAILIAVQIISAESKVENPKKSSGNEEINLNFTSYPYKIVIENIQDPKYELIDVKCDKVDFKKAKFRLNSNKNTCDKLRPCKVYLVKVQLKNNETNQTVPWVKDISTKYAKPEITIGSTLPYNDSIHLNWNATNSECIKEYEINATSFGSTASHTLGNDKNDLDIKNLNPCQNYTIQMICNDIQSATIFNKTFSAETDLSDPGPVKLVKFEYAQNNSTVNVIWEPPDDKFCIHYYDLRWALLSENNRNDSQNYLWHHHNHTEIDVNVYSIQNLTGCEKYIFKISINGDEVHNSFNTTFDSPEQAPGSVQGLKYQSIFSTNVTIEWQIPEQHNSCIRNYRMELFGPNQTHLTFSANESKIFLDNLKPCGIYNFTLKPITLNGFEGEQNNLTFTMIPDNPSPVENLTTENYPKEIYVSWTIPTFAELCIKQYRVQAFHKNEENKDELAFDNTTDRTTITIKNLKSCTIYTIQINALPNGQIANTSAETTPSTSAPPNNVEIKSATHNSLEIRAFDSDRSNNCQVLFARFSCKTDDDVQIKYGETIVDIKGSIGRYSGVIKPLSPYTKYSCKVAIFNIAGWSADAVARFETEKHYPDIPDAIKINYTTTNSIHVIWKPPKYKNGNIVMYKLHIQTLRPLYKIPVDCADIDWIKKTIEVSQTELKFQDAQPYVEYGIQVAAMSDYGVGEFSPMIRIKTEATTPFPISNFRAIKIYGPSLNEEKYEASALLSWKLPCRTNGRVSKFKMTFIQISYPTMSDVNFTREYRVAEDPLVNNVELFIWNETEILPDYNYAVTITMYLAQGYQSSPTRTSFQSPAGIPRKLNISGQAVVDAFVAKNPTTTAVAKISYNIFKNNLGGINYASLLVAETDCQADPRLEFGVMESSYEWPNTSNWLNANSNPKCIRQYQTTPKHWKPLTDDYYSELNEQFIFFTIGTEKDCDTKSSDFCNGPLKPGTKYDVVLRLFTRSGYNDVARLKFQTDSEVQLMLIIILAVTCLCFAFFSGIVYLWITKRMKWHRESINGMESSNGDVNAKNFLLHYAELSKRDKIQREFKELTSITSDLDLSNNASKSNEPKNRYSNIYPYDKNRVILDSDLEGSDYINASFINGYKKKKEYIATQGPKPDCFIDFWRMILQYNVRVIAMVTEMKEGETIKCHQYFPYHSTDSLRFGHNIIVTCKKESIQDTFERRELVVKHSSYGLNRSVIHYFFKKWPDHDCPSDPTDLINFVRKVKSERIPSNSPIVVHCSAGVGRTGTFIGLDVIMQRLKSENRINIFETVKELRFQRMKMVQTIQQYQFLYKCAFQLVKKNFSPINKNGTNYSGTVGSDDIRLNKSNSSLSISERSMVRNKSQSFSPNDIETAM